MKKGKLFQEFELLEGEKILWEGGQSTKAIACKLLEALAIFTVILAAFFFFIWFADFHEPNEIEFSKVEEVDVLEKQQEASLDEKKERKVQVEEYTNRLVKTYLIILFLCIIFSLWYAYIRFKTAWMLITTERVCIQSGALDKSISVIDIDKVVSVVTQQTFVERFFKLQNIEIVHSGVGNIARTGWGNFYNPYKMNYLNLDSEVASKVLLNWLPRDNHQR